MPSSLVTGAVRELFNIGRKLTIRKGAVIVFKSGTAEPDDPEEGTLWFDSANGVLKLYVDDAWETISAA